MVKFFLFNIFFTTVSFAKSCPVLSYEKFLKTIEKKDTMEFFFFATWCGECLQHMKDAPNRIYVAAFDEQKNAEEVFKKLNLTALCYTDDDIAEKLKITSVPAHFLWSDKQLKRIL